MSPLQGVAGRGLVQGGRGLVLAVGLTACHGPADQGSDGGIAEDPRSEPFLDVRWDPETGRGDVVHHLRGGGLLRTCFHCRYPGYTGGLVIGSESGSGCGYYPREPIRGFREINVWCAQDESIRDRADGVEYTYGWSENLGTGDDGRPLEYRGGRVVVDDGERVVLASTNAGGCFEVDKVATTRVDARWWILATRIGNSCDRPVHFDFFSGEDPWLGRYRSSEGDVGWTPEGLVPREAAFGPGELVVGGMYDLGTLAEDQGSFSNQANFIALDPGTAPPDGAWFANRFAHGPDDVDPTRPLDNTTLTALNLGWTDRRLDPGEHLLLAFAMGLATTGEPGEIPRAPVLDDREWSEWRAHLGEAGGTLRFVAERVELSLGSSALEVDGTYVLDNPTPAAMAVGIRYPVSVDDQRPAPVSIEVDGRPMEPVVDEAVASVRFPVEVPAHGLSRFRVRYRQPHSGRHAEYVVSSAQSWPEPIHHAVFVVRHPAALGEVALSLPASRRTGGDQVVLTAIQDDFRPEEELVMRW